MSANDIAVNPVASYPFGFLLSYADVRKIKITEEFLLRLFESLQVNESNLKELFGLKLQRLKAMMAQKEKANNKLDQLSLEIQRINHETSTLQTAKSKKDKSKKSDLAKTKNKNSGKFSVTTTAVSSLNSSDTDERLELTSQQKDDLLAKELQLNEEVESLRCVCTQIESKVKEMKSVALELVVQHSDMESQLMSLDEKTVQLKEQFAQKQQEVKNVSHLVDTLSEKIEQEKNKKLLADAALLPTINNETLINSRLNIDYDDNDNGTLYKKPEDNDVNATTTDKENVSSYSESRCIHKNDNQICQQTPCNNNVSVPVDTENVQEIPDKRILECKSVSKTDDQILEAAAEAEISVREVNLKSLQSKITQLVSEEKRAEHKVQKLQNTIRKIQESIIDDEPYLHFLEQVGSFKKQCIPYSRAQSSMTLPALAETDSEAKRFLLTGCSPIISKQKNFFCQDGSILSNEEPINGAVAPSCSWNPNMATRRLCRYVERQQLQIMQNQNENNILSSNTVDLRNTACQSDTVTEKGLLAGNNEGLEAIYMSKKKTVEDLKKAIKDLDKQEQSYIQIKGSTEAMIKEKKEEQSCIETRLRGVNFELDNVKNELRTKHEVFKALCVKYESFTKELREKEEKERMNVEAMKLETRDLIRKLNTLKSEFSEKEKETSLVKKQIKEAEQETTNLNERLENALLSQSTTKQKINESEASLRLLKDKYLCLQKSNNALECDINAVTKTHEELQKTLEEKQSLCKSVIEHVTQTEKIVEEKTQFLKSLEDKLKDIEANLIKHDSTIKSNHQLMQELTKSCENYTVSISKLKDETSQLEREEFEMKNLLNEKHHVVQRMKEDIDILRGKNEELSREYKATEQKFNVMNKEFKEKRTMILNSHESEQTSLSNISAAIEGIKSERASLEAHYAALTDEFHNQTRSLTKQQSAYENDIAKKKEVIKRLAEELQMLEAEENSLKTKSRFYRNKRKNNYHRSSHKNIYSDNRISSNLKFNNRESPIIASNINIKSSGSNNSPGDLDAFQSEQKKVKHMMTLLELAKERKSNLALQIEKSEMDIEKLELNLRRNEAKINSLNELIFKQQQEFSAPSKAFKESLFASKQSQQVKTVPLPDETISDLNAAPSRTLATYEYHDASTQTPPGVHKEKLPITQQEESLLIPAPQLLQTCEYSKVPETPFDEAESVVVNVMESSLVVEDNVSMKQQDTEPKETEDRQLQLQGKEEKDKLSITKTEDKQFCVEAGEKSKETIITESNQEIFSTKIDSAEVLLHEERDEKKIINESEENPKYLGEGSVEATVLDSTEQSEETECKQQVEPINAAPLGEVQNSNMNVGVNEKESQEIPKQVSEEETEIPSTSMQLKIETTIKNLEDYLALHKSESLKINDIEKPPTVCDSSIITVDNTKNYISSFTLYVRDRLNKLIKNLLSEPKVDTAVASSENNVETNEEHNAEQCAVQPENKFFEFTKHTPDGESGNVSAESEMFKFIESGLISSSNMLAELFTHLKMLLNNNDISKTSVVQNNNNSFINENQDHISRNTTIQNIMCVFFEAVLHQFRPQHEQYSIEQNQKNVGYSLVIQNFLSWLYALLNSVSHFDQYWKKFVQILSKLYVSTIHSFHQCIIIKEKIKHHEKDLSECIYFLRSVSVKDNGFSAAAQNEDQNANFGEKLICTTEKNSQIEQKYDWDTPNNFQGVVEEKKRNYDMSYFYTYWGAKAIHCQEKLEELTYQLNKIECMVSVDSKEGTFLRDEVNQLHNEFLEWNQLNKSKLKATTNNMNQSCCFTTEFTSPKKVTDSSFFNNVKQSYLIPNTCLQFNEDRLGYGQKLYKQKNDVWTHLYRKPVGPMQSNGGDGTSVDVSCSSPRNLLFQVATDSAMDETAMKQPCSSNNWEITDYSSISPYNRQLMYSCEQLENVNGVCLSQHESLVAYYQKQHENLEELHFEFVTLFNIFASHVCSEKFSSQQFALNGEQGNANNSIDSVTDDMSEIPSGPCDDAVVYDEEFKNKRKYNDEEAVSDVQDDNTENKQPQEYYPCTTTTLTNIHETTRNEEANNQEYTHETSSMVGSDTSSPSVLVADVHHPTCNSSEMDVDKYFNKKYQTTEDYTKRNSISSTALQDNHFKTLQKIFEYIGTLQCLSQVLEQQYMNWYQVPSGASKDTSLLLKNCCPIDPLSTISEDDENGAGRANCVVSFPDSFQKQELVFDISSDTNSTKKDDSQHPNLRSPNEVIFLTQCDPKQDTNLSKPANSNEQSDELRDRLHKLSVAAESVNGNLTSSSLACKQDFITGSKGSQADNITAVETAETVTTHFGSAESFETSAFVTRTATNVDETTSVEASSTFEPNSFSSAAIVGLINNNYAPCLKSDTKYVMIKNTSNVSVDTSEKISTIIDDLDTEETADTKKERIRQEESDSYLTKRERSDLVERPIIVSKKNDSVVQKNNRCSKHYETKLAYPFKVSPNISAIKEVAVTISAENCDVARDFRDFSSLKKPTLTSSVVEKESTNSNSDNVPQTVESVPIKAHDISDKHDSETPPKKLYKTMSPSVSSLRQEENKSWCCVFFSSKSFCSYEKENRNDNSKYCNLKDAEKRVKEIYDSLQEVHQSYFDYVHTSNFKIEDAKRTHEGIPKFKKKKTNHLNIVAPAHSSTEEEKEQQQASSLCVTSDSFCNSNDQGFVTKKLLLLAIDAVTVCVAILSFVPGFLEKEAKTMDLLRPSKVRKSSVALTETCRRKGNTQGSRVSSLSPLYNTETQAPNKEEQHNEEALSSDARESMKNSRNSSFYSKRSSTKADESNIKGVVAGAASTSSQQNDHGNNLRVIGSSSKNAELETAALESEKDNVCKSKLIKASLNEKPLKSYRKAPGYDNSAKKRLVISNNKKKTNKMKLLSCKLTRSNNTVSKTSSSATTSSERNQKSFLSLVKAVMRLVNRSIHVHSSKLIVLTSFFIFMIILMSFPQRVVVSQKIT